MCSTYPMLRTMLTRLPFLLCLTAPLLFPAAALAAPGEPALTAPASDAAPGKATTPVAVAGVPPTASASPAAPASPPAATASAESPATAPANGTVQPGLAVRVHHVPVITAPADEELTITATVEASHLAHEILLFVRPSGTTHFEPLVFKRQSADAVGFSITLPAERMTTGVLEYYIASVGINPKPEEPVRLHFASPEHPHPISVMANAELRWRRALLLQHVGNHSRLQAHFEYANFGSRTDPTGKVVQDAYYRAEADYTYRFLGWIYSIRLGAGVLLGQTYLQEGSSLIQIPDDTRCNASVHTATDCRVGLYYGFADLRFRFGRLVRLDARPILGVGPQSFDGGASLQLLVGYDPGRHVALGFEAVTHIGVRAWLRLGWDTVPHVPMAFIIDLENFPNGDALGMRLMMNFSYRFQRHFSMDLLAGYATRGWQIGGPTLGGGLVAEF